MVRVIKYHRRIKRAKVYDLEVEEAGCFYANGLLVHNCHHLRGKEWHRVPMDFHAYYRIGMSATAFPDLEAEHEKGAIWLKACCGAIKIDISTSRLVEEGWLVRPTIELHTITEPNLLDLPWSKEMQRAAIDENPHRNGKIVEIVSELVRGRGLKTLVISNRLKQSKLLAKAISGLGIGCRRIVGTTPSEKREQAVAEFVGDGVDVLVGTVFGEGVDLKEIEAVVVAEGGRSVINTIQRMRQLTPCDGKTEAILVDFVDRTNGYLAEHSLARLQTYRSEPAFRLELKD